MSSPATPRNGSRSTGASAPRGATVHAAGWGWRHAGRNAWAVTDLDLHIAPGERVLLLGASGSGKSTLVHALAGVLGTDEGEERGTLMVDGQDPRGARGRAALVLQDPDSQVILARVGDDVAFGCENLGVPRDETWRRVEAALDMVGLPLPLAHPTSNLSGGQKQRLALAGVLAMQPGLLLLDEPTANLDPDGVTEVRDAVARVLDSTGATLIVIEHRVAVWQDLVDRVIVLDAAGGVLADGHPAAVLARHGDALAASGVWVPWVEHRMASRRPTESGHALISAENLSIARSRKVPVAANIDVTVRSGEVLAITGPNGSGKSTLALTLAGLLRPHAGHVVATDLLAAGAALAPVDWKSRQLLPRIGMVFQDPEHQFLTGTVRAELAVGPRALRLGREEVDRRVDMLLDRLRLAGLADANPFTLSGGEKRRLSVATALASQPRMLVLDEPTFGQDFRTWQEIVALLGELADDGAGIVAVSHDGEFIDALADRRFALAPSVTDARNGTGIR